MMLMQLGPGPYLQTTSLTYYVLQFIFCESPTSPVNSWVVMEQPPCPEFAGSMVLVLPGLG